MASTTEGGHPSGSAALATATNDVRGATDAVRTRLAALLRPDWLAAQRWMRAKHRTPNVVEVEDLVVLEPPRLWLAVVRTRDADGGGERYALPVVADGPDVRLPRDGDGAWRAIAALTLEAGVRFGLHGTLRGEPLRRVESVASVSDIQPGLPIHGLPERQLAVEQSNSSAVLGDSLIVKLYRLLEPGENPEPEMLAFLTEAGFRHVPAFHGTATYEPTADPAAGLAPEGEAATYQPAALALSQAYVPNQGDGWAWALQALASQEGAERALAEIAGIGSLTAHLHRALRSRPDDPAFPDRIATPEERAVWRRAAEERLEWALAALTEPGHGRLRSIAGAVRERTAPLGGTDPARVCRIHGDYHLGQLLRTADGFVIIDFEGEPARPLAERRGPASPLRDVAGMLRSLDYAAQTAVRAVARAAARTHVDAAAWLADARSAFLGGYGALDAHADELLAAFEIEKACYEVGYEARNRPGWTWLPLEALERLVR